MRGKKKEPDVFAQLAALNEGTNRPGVRAEFEAWQERVLVDDSDADVSEAAFAAWYVAHPTEATT